jgi:hypothetical protein
MKRKFGLRVVLSVLLILAIAFMASGCVGSTSSGGEGTSDYKSVVKGFMDSIDTQNTKKFLNSFQKDDREDILDDYDEKELKEMLAEYDEEMTDEYGKSWCKDIELGKRKEVDDDDDVVYYTIPIEIDGDEVETIPFIKVKDKYYIDPDALDILSGGGGGGGGSSSGGTKKGPEQVIINLFKSIDEHDVDLFLSCFRDELVEQMLEYSDKDEIEEELIWIDESAEDEQGKNWIKLIKVGKAKKVGTEDGITYYDVPVSFDGEEEIITVIEVKGKYYIDDSELGELF